MFLHSERPLQRASVQQRARGIRPCQKDDLPAVAALYELVVRSGTRAPPPRLADYFERTFFDCPWADPEIPSLVYADDGGSIVGFLGSHVRRARVDGRAIRLAYGGQLVVDPEVRSRAVGAMLFRTHLWGPQEATITDGANDTVRRMWEICGGETSHLKTMTWTRILRPARFASDYVLAKLRRPWLARRLRPLCKPLDSVGPLARRLRPALPGTSAGPLDARALLEHMPAVTDFLRCYPDYDEAFLAWLFREMPAVASRGTLVRSLVRDSGGEVLGWYVYYLESAFSQVLQVAAKRGAAGAVLDDLFHHAHANGTAALGGRLEPQLVEPLSKRRCIFGWSGGALIHSRNRSLLGVLLSSQCWLGRMDGEWWMGHHAEGFK